MQIVQSIFQRIAFNLDALFHMHAHRCLTELVFSNAPNGADKMYVIRVDYVQK